MTRPDETALHAALADVARAIDDYRRASDELRDVLRALPRARRRSVRAALREALAPRSVAVPAGRGAERAFSVGSADEPNSDQ